MYLRVDNKEYAEITEFLGISKTTRLYDTHPEQPVNQTEFNPLTRRFATTSPLYFYKTEVCKKKKDMLFIDKIGFRLHLPLCVHRFSPCLLHSPSANLTENSISLSLSPSLSFLFHPFYVRRNDGIRGSFGDLRSVISTISPSYYCE